VERLQKHLIPIGLIAIVVALLYATLSGAWFCGYDDFSEAHRAAFDDSANPVRIVTTTHNMKFMYRPITSGLQYLTWNLFNHSPLAFRLRNLGMHLISVAMLYGIVWLIAGSRSIAAGAALLFGVHPLANETVAIAIWTNATAYAFLLASFFLFLLSLRWMDAGRNWRPLLASSLVCAFVAIFTYEPTIVVFALIAGFLFVRKARDLTVPRPYFVFLAAGTVLELSIFFFARHLVITQAAPFNPLSIVVRNAVTYCAALVLPIDFVFAHVVFGTPFPSQATLGPWTVASVAFAVAVLLVALVFMLRRPLIQRRLAQVDKPLALFLLSVVPLGVLPLLLFREHPSEHDLYLSIAFYAAFLCLVARRVTRSLLQYWIIVLLLAIPATAATSVRNERVEDCARIAHRIIGQLPVDNWHKGKWHILLATTPGQHLGEPYGAYNDYGLHALETEKGLTPGAQDALQLAAHNEGVTARVVNDRGITLDCVGYDLCFFVSRLGDVASAVTATRVSRPQSVASTTSPTPTPQLTPMQYVIGTTPTGVPGDGNTCAVYASHDWFDTDLLIGGSSYVPTSVDPNSSTIVDNEVRLMAMHGGAAPYFGAINASNGSIAYSATAVNLDTNSTPLYVVKAHDSEPVCYYGCYTHDGINPTKSTPWVGGPTPAPGATSVPGDGYLYEGSCGSGDCHTIVLDTKHCYDYETFAPGPGAGPAAAPFNATEFQASSLQTHSLSVPYNNQLTGGGEVTAGGIPLLGTADTGDDEERYMANGLVIPHPLYGLMPGDCSIRCALWLSNQYVSPAGAPGYGGCSPKCFGYGMRLQLVQSDLPEGSCTAQYPVLSGETISQAGLLCLQLVHYGLMLSDIGAGCPSGGGACVLVTQLTADHNNGNPWIANDIQRIGGATGGYNIPLADFQLIKVCGGNTGIVCSGQ
jgi:hypothetical protein